MGAEAANAASVEVLQAEQIEQGVEHAWRALAVARENPFLTPDWFGAWLGLHGDESPFVLVWRGDDGQVRGVLPLVRATLGPLPVLRFAGARRADWLTPACLPEDEPAMAAACSARLLAERRRWRVFLLDRVPRGSSWPHALRARSGRSVLAPTGTGRSDVLPYIAFGPGGYDDYLARRSRNLRSQLGRRRRRLEREHGLAFRLVEDVHNIDRGLRDLFDLRDARWEGRGRAAPLTTNLKKFHHRFARAALGFGWLRLWIAELEGQDAAAWYGWRIGARYCYYLSGFDPRWERMGLGNVMLAHTIEQAALEGADVYDMLWGDEDYKRRFETGRRYVDTYLLGRRFDPLHLTAVAWARAESRARALPPGVRAPLKRAYRAVMGQ